MGMDVVRMKLETDSTENHPYPIVFKDGPYHGLRADSNSLKQIIEMPLITEVLEFSENDKLGDSIEAKPVWRYELIGECGDEGCKDIVYLFIDEVSDG